MNHQRVRQALAAPRRLRTIEFVFWLATIAAYVLLPERSLLLNETAILGLFALSLDLVLGIAGIVSLGHAAFFGLGAKIRIFFYKLFSRFLPLSKRKIPIPKAILNVLRITR